MARRFAAAGHALVLVARREAPLQALAAELRATHGVRAEVLTADLARPGAAQDLAATLRRKRRRIDVLVNNAGVLAQGAFTALDPGRHDGLVALNVAAPTALLAAFLPAMQRRGAGRVLNVASVAAFQSLPGLASYAASKAYLLSLSEALAEELRDSGITVTALCPGITATDMLTDATTHNARLAALPGLVIGDADAVAEAGVRACLAGDVIVVPGLVNQAAILASRATPRGLLRRVAGAVSRRLG